LPTPSSGRKGDDEMEKIKFEANGKYRGYTIEFREWDNEWVAKKDGEEIYSKPEIKKIKEYIDKLLKSDFTPIQAYTRENYNYNSDKYEIVTITSVDNEGKVWVVDKNKSREKKSQDEVFSFSDENSIIIKEILGILKQEEELSDKKEKLEEKLKPAL
jgi:hypothetical protein